MTKTIKKIEIIVDGQTEMIMAEQLSGNIYYCLEAPVFIDLDLYGCEIEVNNGDEKLKFLKIHKTSGYSTYKYLWSKEFLDSEKGKSIKQKILDAGGDWEQVMGGFLFIHLPKEKDDLLNEILKIAE